MSPRSADEKFPRIFPISKRNTIDTSCARPSNDGADDGHVLKMLSDMRSGLSAQDMLVHYVCERHTPAEDSDMHRVADGQGEHDSSTDMP